MFFSFIFSIFSSEILLSVMKEFTIDIEPKLANALIPILEESATRMTSSAAFIMADLTIRSLRQGIVCWHGNL